MKKILQLLPLLVVGVLGVAWVVAKTSAASGEYPAQPGPVVQTVPSERVESKIVGINKEPLRKVAADSTAAPLNAEVYARYCNDRYGFCVSYPSHFLTEPPPDNNDGRSFHDRNGMVVTASGINNVLMDTLQTEIHSCTEDFDTVTYQAKGKNWFVLSGVKGANILYVKTFVGVGSINHLYIEYPARLKTKYDAMVAEIARSFTPGRLKVAH